MLGQLTQLTRLDDSSIDESTPLEQIWALTNLTNLEILDAALDLPAAILSHLPNLQSIYITTKEHVEVSRTLSKLELAVYSFNNYAVSNYVAEDLQVLPDPLKLRQLTLVGNRSGQSFDTLNECWTRYSNLTSLFLSNNNRLIGEDLSPNSWNIPTLPNLERLSMQWLETVQSISSLNSKLTQLWLGCEDINCNVFTPLPNLANLMLSGKIHNISSLGSLTKLKNLALSFMNSLASMEDMGFLSKLPNLEVFDIGSETDRRNWSESLQYFSENNNLKTIYFSYGSSQSFGSYMTKFHKLESMDCSTIDLQSTYHMTALTNLTKLEVSTMTPEMFANIEKLTALKYLSFNASCDEESNLQQLNLGKLTNLEILRITQSPQVNKYSIMFDGIHDLGRLHYLNIDWPVLTESFFVQISQCTSLVDLRVRADISDETIVPLAKMTSLKSLIITPKTEEFTGVNLTCVTSLRQLSVMSFVKLVFTAEDLRQKLPNLRSCSI